MINSRFRAYFEPASEQFPGTVNVKNNATPAFAAVPQAYGVFGFNSAPLALYAWAKKQAVAEVAVAAKRRRIWSISRN